MIIPEDKHSFTSLNALLISFHCSISTAKGILCIVWLNAYGKVKRIEDENGSRAIRSWVGQVALVGTGGKSHDTVLIRWCILDSMEHLHVANIVDEDLVLQTDYQSLQTQMGHITDINKELLC